jgi:hypothetical protein
MVSVQPHVLKALERQRDTPFMNEDGSVLIFDSHNQVIEFLLLPKLPNYTPLHKQTLEELQALHEAYPTNQAIGFAYRAKLAVSK